MLSLPNLKASESWCVCARQLVVVLENESTSIATVRWRVRLYAQYAVAPSRSMLYVVGLMRT